MSPSLLVPQTLENGERLLFLDLLILWGNATLSSLEKIPLGPWAAGKLPKRKFTLARSGFQPWQSEVERHPSQFSFPGWCLEVWTQSLTTECQHLPDTPPLPASSPFGGEAVQFSGWIFFSVSPSHHKILMCQQAIPNFPSVTSLSSTYCYTSINPAVSPEDTAVSNWSCLDQRAISGLI